jgi:hypothetical protein
MNNMHKDYQDFTDNRTQVPVEPTSTHEIIQFVEKTFPNRPQFKIDWLRFEQDIRRALTLETSYENRLMIIDILLANYTGRGTELAPRN